MTPARPRQPHLVILPGQWQHQDMDQAQRALRRAAELAGPVATWAELGPYSLLLRIPDLDQTALPAELQRLLSVDPERQLVRTLQVYLEYGCNGPAASTALHIHRTTLYYRLGRISELTELDLDDGRRLTLHLGLTALDVIGVHGPSSARESSSQASNQAVGT